MTDETETLESVEFEVVETASITFYQIEVGPDDVITRTMSGNRLSEGFIEVDQATHDAAVSAIFGGHGAWYRDGQVVPMPPPPPPPIVLSAELLFFERMTDAEYDGLDDSVRSGETARVYRGWSAATSFTEGSDMWALLVKHLTPDPNGRWAGVSDERRVELLARP